MQADFSVELGGDAPALEIPWRSNDPRVRYYDLKIHPELVLQIPEAVAYPELGLFLSRINAAGFPLATAKCDAWPSSEVAPEEQIFGDRKFVSYVDLIFVNEKDRCSFEKNEAFAKELCRLLGHAPEIAATVELVIRHCYCQQGQIVSNNCPEPPPAKSRIGPLGKRGNAQLERKAHWERPNASVTAFCLTIYVIGFGDSDHDPVRRWTVGLNLLQHAIVQLSSNSQPKP
ncbi:MAG TPA: hypothetical protein VN658_06290 [Candidatus Acidoferrales bacterium]|nr:hypothetical protein [Candidatus Acidoferrales bacterium]